jgi:hypothetical protein
MAGLSDLLRPITADDEYPAEFDALPFTEPALLDEILITGVSITKGRSGIAHCVGTTIMLDGDGRPVERRIVVRAAVPPSVIRRAIRRTIELWLTGMH